MRPYPATTPSPGYCCSCIPKSRHRCVMNLSISSKESLSRSRAIRSRAVILPSAFWRSMRSEAVILATRQTLLDHGHFFPVLQELFNSLVREGMLQKLIEYFCRHSADVGTHQTCLHYMNRIADGRHENFCREFVIIKDRDDVLDEFHAVLTNVVQAADERADEIGAGLGGHDRLRR